MFLKRHLNKYVKIVFENLLRNSINFFNLKIQGKLTSIFLLENKRFIISIFPVEAAAVNGVQ